MKRSQSWSEKFLKQLADAKPSERIAATFFVDPSVPASKLTQFVEQALKKSGAGDSLSIANISPLANAFSVDGTREALTKLAGQDKIRGALRDDQSDILPRPRNMRTDDASVDESFTPLNTEKRTLAPRKPARTAKKKQ